MVHEEESALVHEEESALVHEEECALAAPSPPAHESSQVATMRLSAGDRSCLPSRHAPQAPCDTAWLTAIHVSVCG